MSKKDTMPLEKLFGSKTRAKLLALFFENSDKSYYVREITRVIEEQINSVRRELTNLSTLGLVKIENFENKVYYSANMKHPFAKAMREIFSQKIDEVVELEAHRPSWQDYIRPAKDYIVAVAVTNRAPGESGLDLLIVGDDSTKKLSRWAEVVEKKQGKPLNYVIFSRNDYLYRKAKKDKFLARFWAMNISEKYDPDRIL